MGDKCEQTYTPRFIVICAIIALVISCLCLCLVACDNHSHVFGKWETVTEATCGKEGLRERVCSICNSVEQNIIEPTGFHTYNALEQCSICGNGLTFKYDSASDSYSVTNYNGTKNSIQIPLEYNNKIVSTIDDYAFKNCANLTSISIPNSVVKIGKGAFEGCNNLVSLSLPFVGGNKNTTAKRQESSDFDYSYAFGYIFGGEYKSGFELSQNEPSNTIDWIYQGARSYWYRDSNKGKMYQGFYGYHIPSTLRNITITNATGISAYAFYGCSMLTSIIILDGVTTIGEKAFSSCNGISSITIPNSVTDINISAFNSCINLESILVNENNLNYASQTGVLYNKNKTHILFVPTAIQGAIVIPDGVTIISKNEFYNRNKITSITIADSVTAIDESAFKNCIQLEWVKLSSNLASIGDSAFYNCTNLTNIFTFAGITRIGKWAFYNCTTLSSIIIPDDVRLIDEYAFAKCKRLVYIVIPTSLTTIANHAFEECISLKYVFSMFLAGGNPNIGNNGNSAFTFATIYNFSSSEPSPYWTGKYWHYVNNIPTIWD